MTQPRSRGPRPPRPYPRQPYAGRRPAPYRKKRQAGPQELTFTLIIVGILAVGALSARSSQAMPLAVAGLVILGLAVVAGMLVVQWQRWREQQRLRLFKLLDIDTMDGFAFEKYVAQLLQARGYQHVRITEQSDLGIDVIAEKDGIRWGIQVKRNRGKVRAGAVRAAVTALNYYKCNRAMVITNSTFSGPATQLASSNQCVLVGRRELAKWIEAFGLANKS